MITNKPFAPAAHRNRDAILEALKPQVKADELVFEFGSGTGQHLCHFAKYLPAVQWQPSDLADKLPGIELWIKAAECPNILPAIELDLNLKQTHLPCVSHCFSANTLHIIRWSLVESLFEHASAMLKGGGKLFVYGPFLRHGRHFSDSNRQFDQQLKTVDPLSGIRDIVDLDKLASRLQFSQVCVQSMPANNHLLSWERLAS